MPKILDPNQKITKGAHKQTRVEWNIRRSTSLMSYIYIIYMIKNLIKKDK